MNKQQQKGFQKDGRTKFYKSIGIAFRYVLVIPINTVKVKPPGNPEYGMSQLPPTAMSRKHKVMPLHNRSIG
jgi:hypothetical protein